MVELAQGSLLVGLSWKHAGFQIFIYLLFLESTLSINILVMYLDITPKISLSNNKNRQYNNKIRLNRLNEQNI